MNRRRFLQTGIATGSIILSGCGGLFGSKTGIKVVNEDNQPHDLQLIIRKTSDEPQSKSPKESPGPQAGDVWRLEKTYYDLQSGAEFLIKDYLTETGTYWIRVDLLQEQIPVVVSEWVRKTDREDEPYVAVNISQDGTVSVSHLQQ